MSGDPIESFRCWLESELGGGDRGALTFPDPCDGSRLEARLAAADRSYYDIRIVSDLRQLEVGLSTESRVVNEEIEEFILEQGGDLDDLLADELIELGGDELPMHHFFERPRFRFTCRLPIPTPEALEGEEICRQTLLVIDACRALFQPHLE